MLGIKCIEVAKFFVWPIAGRNDDGGGGDRRERR